MAQVGKFEVNRFYSDSVSVAFKADKVRLVAAVAVGLIGYGLLRRLEVGRFASLSIGSAPVIIYEAYSLRRAQIQMGATALAKGEVQVEELPQWIRQAAADHKAANDEKISEAFKSPISTLKDGTLYRVILLSALPKEGREALIRETPGLEGESVEVVVGQYHLPNDQLMSQEVIQALFAKYGWQKSQVDPSPFSQVVAAIRLLDEYRESLPLIQHHLQRNWLSDSDGGFELLRGGKTDFHFNLKARQEEIKAAIAPTYSYTQVCPDQYPRVRTLSSGTHLKIFAWLWCNVNDEAKKRMIQGIRSPLFVPQELDSGVLPETNQSRYDFQPEPTMSRESTIAFLAMKGRPRYFEERHGSFSVGCVALAGLILDLCKGEDLDHSPNKQEIKQQLEQQLTNQFGIKSELLEGRNNLFDKAINLIKLGQPSN